MSYTVIWSDRAKKTITDVINYLREEWTEKEVNEFLDRVDDMVTTISSNPRLFRASFKRPNVHLALIHRRTYLVYQVLAPKKQIAILLFWGPKQNPKKLKY